MEFEIQENDIIHEIDVEDFEYDEVTVVIAFVTMEELVFGD